jgi:diguanylate cyclase (GGDEF)-like protein
LNVLVIEDDPVTRKILAGLLTKRGYIVTACPSAETAIEAYRKVFYPLLFLDLFLPGLDGFSFCRWIRNQPKGNKHLILVGTSSESKADLQKILAAGADDYIIKPYRSDALDIRLIIAEQALKNIEARTALEANLLQEREQLRYQSTHDSLTNLLNRPALMERVEDAVKAAEKGSKSALLYLDLDNFKLVNDSGHAAGDKVLSNLATFLQSSIRAQDLASRISGDEFAILLQGMTLEEAKALAEQILSQLEQFAFTDSSRAFYIGTSIGIAMIDGTVSAEAALAFADSACCAAKIHGKNRVETYDDKDESMAEMRSEGPRLAEIREAISGQRFELVFQPIVDLRTLQPIFFEVLIRMDSGGKLLFPRSFIPTAERFHLISEIDRQVIRKTIPYLVAHHDLCLAVNLSGQSFADETLVQFIESCYKSAQIDPARLIFEVTETAVISNLAAARTMMHRLRDAGYRFSLDDFGAGFSSLKYLKELVPDFLKIDGSFIPSVKSDEEAWIFVEMINDIAHRLKIECIAECVEEELTLAKLRQIGVGFGQGYLFGKPSSPPDALWALPDFRSQEAQKRNAEGVASAWSHK